MGLVLLGSLKVIPCTVAVVSGKATADGKPLLWKNRDAPVIDNKILRLKGSKHVFIALVNAADPQGTAVWAGINTEGFAIMNAASSDLADNEKGGATRLRNYGGEGVLQKLHRIENEVIAKAESKLHAWEKSTPSFKEIADFEAALAAWVFESLKASFPDLIAGK
ncbi:MAG: hypothetical protein QHH14_10110 [Clostridiales bacterium]|jgi:hypothetical protein|nr:hypothetical protein [Clostridiales bacterium]